MTNHQNQLIFDDAAGKDGGLRREGTIGWGEKLGIKDLGNIFGEEGMG